MNDSRQLRQCVLRESSVALYKILKFEGLVDSGANAKQCIADGDVCLNGDVETRKRRQVRSGDRIEFAGVIIEVVATRD